MAYLEGLGAPLFIGEELESYSFRTLTTFRVCRPRLIRKIFFLLGDERVFLEPGRLHFFNSRIDTIKEKVKDAFYQNLQSEQGDKIRERLIKDISGEIELCLTKMADVAEIPLG